MKRSLVLKALSTMDQEKVTKFLDYDCRSLDEIVDAVADECEKSYIYFMVELFEIVKELEKEEKEKSDKISLSELIKSGSLVQVEKSPLHNQLERFSEIMKEYHPINITIPKYDFSNLVPKRGD